MHLPSTKIILAAVSAALTIIGLGLAWYWFGWKLALILFVVLCGQNIFIGEISGTGTAIHAGTVLDEEPDWARLLRRLQQEGPRKEPPK